MTKNIWPRQLPDHVRKDRRRRAEVKVYDRISEELPDKFHVFYSSPWLAIDRFGNEKDGECDFVVAHEKLGILAIEVKGGGIAFHPTSGQWTSTDRHKIVHNIRDPVEQARSAKYNILDKLKRSENLERKWINIRYGVVFPDAATPSRSLGADKPTQIFCAHHHFQHNFVDWINERLCDSSGDSQNGEDLGRDGIAALERMFAFPFTLSFRISAAISEDVRSLDLLEHEQFLLLDYMSEILRARIEGAAGTGKTILAVEAAIRSGKVGNRTLLTCFNKPLATDLKRRLDGTDNVMVENFHSLCFSMANAVGLPVLSKMEDQSFFEDYLPELLIKALCANESLRFDHIIVDEGQDFLENWWLAIDEAVAEGGRLHALLDPNQCLYNRHSEFSAALELVPIQLNRNLRNTQRIHKAAMVHYSGPTTSAPGPLGIELNWVEIGTASSAPKAIYDEVKRLVYQENLDPADIAVLVPDSETRDAFMIASARSSLIISDAESVSSEALIVDTVRRFKGLERNAVVLCLAGVETRLTQLAYSGMTRARAALSIVCQSKDRVWIEQGLRTSS